MPSGEVKLIQAGSCGMPRQQSRERTRLIEHGNGFAGEEIRARGGEDLEAPRMELDEFADGETVVAAVLRAVVRDRAVGPDGRGDPQPASSSGDRADSASRAELASSTESRSSAVVSSASMPTAANPS